MEPVNTPAPIASPGRADPDEDPLCGLMDAGLLGHLNAATRELLRLKFALAIAQADPATDLPRLRGLSLAVEGQTRLIRD